MYHHHPVRLTSMTLAIHLALAGVALSCTPLAQAQSAASAMAERKYDIPAGTLDAVLARFASESGALIAASPDSVAGRHSPGLRGSYNLAAAIDALLKGSGLRAERTAQGQYRLEVERAAESAVLPGVTVSAQPEQDGASEGTGRYTSSARLATATPLGLTLKETPQSVSVFTRQRMDDQGLTTIGQVMAQVPGITAGALGTERTMFASRGYTIDNYQLDGVNTTSLNTGLAAQASQSMADMAIYDRVEVLRGASGLMSGAGDPSGAINMVRKKPTAEFQGMLEAEGGSWRQKRGIADVSGPLNAARSVRGRVVAAWQDGDSFIDYYSNDKKVFYGVLDADLSETTRLTIGVEHQRRRTRGATAYLGFPLWYSNGARTDLPRSFNSASADNQFNSRSTSAFATLEQELGQGWRLKVSANRLHSTQREEVVYMETNYAFADAVSGDGLNLSADLRNHRVENDSVDVNVRGPVSLFGRQHELVFGADYQDQRNVTHGSLDEGGLTDSAVNLYRWNHRGTGRYGAPFVTFDSPVLQRSLYAAARFDLSDQLKFIAGTKVFRYDANAVTENRAGYYSSVRSAENNVWTPYAGVVYDIDRTHTAYASYSTIYKPQTAQDRYGQLIDPREGANYELGLKSGWLDGQLDTAVALYQIRQDNLTESDPGYVIPGTTNAASRAIKGAKTQGFDIEASGALSKDWNISTSWAYSQSKNGKGERITTTFPRHVVKLWTTYRLPADLRRITVGGGVNWYSKTYSTVSAWQIGRNLYWEQKSYAVANLMARFDVNAKLSATLNVNNAFDKHYITSVSDWWYSGYYGAPRSVALNVKYKF